MTGELFSVRLFVFVLYTVFFFYDKKNGLEDLQSAMQIPHITLEKSGVRRSSTFTKQTQTTYSISLPQCCDFILCTSLNRQFPWCRGLLCASLSCHSLMSPIWPTKPYSCTLQLSGCCIQNKPVKKYDVKLWCMEGIALFVSEEDNSCAPPSLSSHYCIDAVTSLGGDVTGSVELEHPCLRQQSHLDRSVVSNGGRAVRANTFPCTGLHAVTEGGREGRSVGTTHRRPSRVHGEERLLAEAAPDLEETGGGGGGGGWKTNQTSTTIFTVPRR